MSSKRSIFNNTPMAVSEGKFINKIINIPNFHVIHYLDYESLDNIQSYVLDFGLNAVTAVNEFNIESRDKEEFKKAINKCQNEITEIVNHHILNVLFSYDFELLYKNAIIHPFKEVEVNLWKEFIKMSRKFKTLKLKNSFDNYIKEQIENTDIENENIIKKFINNEIEKNNKEELKLFQKAMEPYITSQILNKNNIEFINLDMAA